MILFAGASLSGRRTLVKNLRWPLTSTWTDLVSGVLGPAAVSWRGRQLVAELGYRGAYILPRLDATTSDLLPAPAWTRYRTGRIDSLQRATGVLFVVDSQAEVALRNVAALQSLAGEFHAAGRQLGDVPVLFALNKRDLPSALPMPELVAAFQLPMCAHVETSAITGLGVAQCIDDLLALIDERAVALG